MFGYKIIRESDYEDLKRSYIKLNKLAECRRWFSGWKDLNIIWDYVSQDSNFGGIERARKEYADARKTNEYGTPLR